MPGIRSRVSVRDIDDRETIGEHRAIIENKAFLRRVYQDWYRSIASCVPTGEGRVLEVGSGAGFFLHYVPGVITSDIAPGPDIRLLCDATALPIESASLRAIVMTNVLHHIAQPREFFHDAARVVRVGGALVMLEPWMSTWSRFIYRYLHHEPCHPSVPAWEFHSSGRLSGANQALPWIVFKRDRDQFEREFRQWQVDLTQPLMPLSYLLSGGLSRLTLAPAFTYRAWRRAERVLERWPDQFAMFALIRLTRRADQ